VLWLLFVMAKKEKTKPTFKYQTVIQFCAN